MAYDELLAERARQLLRRRRGYGEKKMFGGLCFLIHGNMACGVTSERRASRAFDNPGRPASTESAVNSERLRPDPSSASSSRALTIRSARPMR